MAMQSGITLVLIILIMGDGCMGRGVVDVAIII
jgi:hypothetical protein